MQPINESCNITCNPINMAYSAKERLYIPHLRYRHICRYFANDRTELSMAKVFTKKKLVSDIYFLDNNVTGTTTDPNCGNRNIVNIAFRSTKIKSYYDIDTENTCCDNENCSSCCAHVGAVMLKIIDPTSTKTALACS